jgi:hypothetical protein
MTKYRYAMSSLTVFIVLALSIMNTVPVLADDTLPPTETPVVESPPMEETTVAEALASVPPETEVVVLNESGEALPLATQEAAEALYEGDPMWCPAGVTPGGSGCTISYGSLQLLVADVGSGFTPAANGVIWIENVSFVSTGAIVLDGNLPGVWPAWSNYSLALKGGWSGSGTTITTTPSTIQDSLSIVNWNADVTLSNILITNVAIGSALRDAALDIETTKKITLTNVQVNANTGAGTVNGAVLDNEDASGGVFGDVTITNSTFNDNDDYGLKVESEGTITLAGVLANGNGALGAYLRNIQAATPKSVIITSGTNEFSNNLNDGLQIDSAGSITLKDLTALNNSTMGMRINNTFGSAASAVTLTGTTIVSENLTDGINVASDGIITASNLIANLNGGSGASFNNSTAATALGVTVSGSSQFKYNVGNGLNISSNGAILANNITANGNTAGVGATFDNDGFAGGSAAVTLTGTNSFQNNSNSGLEIFSDGIVTLNNISSNDNGGFGLNVQNSGALTPKAVLLNGTNKLDDNLFDGLHIESIGTVTVNNLSASSNDGSGVDIDNFNGSAAQNVTMNGYVTVTNNVTGSGLSITSSGTVTLNKVTANDNGQAGILVANNNATAPKTIMINGFAIALNNGVDGIDLLSLGAITLNNTTASANGEFGLIANTVGGITLNGTSSFSANDGSGLELYSYGNILIKDLEANGNGFDQNPLLNGHGAYLYNSFSGATGNITVGGKTAGWVNEFDDNFLSGLEIYSNGTVTLSNIEAAGNGLDNGVDAQYGFGVFISNGTAATPKNVTILGENYFGYNYIDGLNISTKGAVTLNKIIAEGNDVGYGVYIANNFDPSVQQNVTLNGYGDFTENGADGLSIHTFGMITLNSIFAAGNLDTGIYLDNATSATIVKPVTINGYALAYGNGDFGVYVNSLGAIKINNLEASFGNLDGALLDNDEAGATGGVTLTGSNGVSANTLSGLTIFTRGAILINDLDAVGNLGGFGAYLDNSSAATPLAVTLTNTTSGVSDFSENFYSGLVVDSRGAVTITNLMANSNGEGGVIINNRGSGTATPQMVTLNGYGQFSNNGDDGLVVLSYGAITTNNLTAIDNGQNSGASGYGVYLDNCDHNGSNCNALTAKSVTLNGTNLFTGNWLDGLNVQSLGAIKANNLTASYNTGNGANLRNEQNFGSFSVTLTGTNEFEFNNMIGLVAATNGPVTLNNVSANSNNYYGVFVESTNAVTQAQVNFTGTNYFNDNSNDGLFVITDASITLNNITANGNGASGVMLDNATVFFPLWTGATIKLTGINTFNENTFAGLAFNANGNVDISNITADNNDPTNSNGGSGVSGSSSTGSVTITCGSMITNGGYGWRLGAATTITLKGVFTADNFVGETNLMGGTLVTSRTCPLP